jgi:DNA-directed RNA polymerase specialized sigma24 family protein
MLAALAEFERELILERTIPESVAREVRERRARGESLRMISQRMNVKLGGVRSVLSRDRGSTAKPASPVAGCGEGSQGSSRAGSDPVAS